jgi:hypothetical protein
LYNAAIPATSFNFASAAFIASTSVIASVIPQFSAAGT